MNLGRKLLRRKLLLLLLTLALAGPALPQDTRPKETIPAEHHIAKAEAKQLFRSVDEILKFASTQTGLPILHPVKKKLATREQVAKYVAKRLKEQDNVERFERTALPLKRLGLLPRDFDLRHYMLDLYKEQVEGWYDTHSKTIYMLDWVSPNAQKPVLAVHALQDQNFDLDRWLNVAKDSKDPNVQLALEEQRVARQSVVEGQAMAVLMAYQNEGSGASKQSVEAGDNAANSGLNQEDSTPVYEHAPLYLREALLFPYTYGLEFVRVLQAQRGKQAAFAGVFMRPPADTRQVMQPSTYLTAEPQPQIQVAPLESLLGPEWRREDVSGLGEIDLRILLRVWGGDEAAARLSEAWHGGYYVALAKTKAPADTPPSLALVLQLNTAQAAQSFAIIYISALTTRYDSVQPAAFETPMIQPAASTMPPSPRLRQWMTEQGLVSLYVDGTSIVALESFAPADAAKLHAALVPTPLVRIAATY